MKREPIDDAIDRKFYTPAEIAGRWQCSLRHVRRVIASGGLPVHRFGKIVRVSHTDLRAHEKTRRMDPGLD